jgi:AmiR/NasT family two-component response regulator
MNRQLRIVIADDEKDVRDHLALVLPRIGHLVIGAAGNGRELVELCRSLKPDLVITDIKMPEVDGIDAAVTICEERPVAVIVLSAYYDHDLIERAEHDHVMGYLVKPVMEKDLPPAIGIAVARFEQFNAIRTEAASLRQALDERKIIERAKGIVMKRSGLSEADAFARLQKLARDGNKRLVEIARSVLTAEEAYRASGAD